MPRSDFPTLKQSMAPPPAQAGAGDSVVQELEKLYSEAKSARVQLEPTWFLNLAYYAGDQWVMYDGGRLTKPKLRSDRVLLVDNRIQPAVRRLLAKKTKTRPTFEAMPTTPLEDDVYAALLAEEAMTDLWRRLHLTKRLRTALKWADICGAGFWKVFWDASVGSAGEALIKPDGSVLTDQLGRPMKGQQFDEVLSQLGPEEAALLNGRVTRKTVREGEVGVEVRSPFQLAPDPLAETLDEAEWLVEEVVKSPDYVKQRYGVEVRPDAQAVVGLLEGRMSTSQAGGAQTNLKGVKVKEFWAKPSSKYPKGKRVVWAGQKLLLEADNAAERLPYVMFTGVEVPGRFWPTSVTEQMRGPQTELNKVKSQVAENRSRIGNPIVLISKQSGVKMHGVPGERVHYDDTTQNSVPRYLQPPEMPAYVQNEIATIEASLAEIVGQHEVSSAQVPAGVTAAAAIQLLQEADDTMLGPVIEDMEQAIAEAGEMMLEFVAEKYTTARKMRIAGPDATFDIRDFNGAMLRGNTRINVRAGSTMPQSKAARKAEMMQALTLFVQNGVQLTERNLRKFFQEYDAGALERLFGNLSVDERQIHREHQRMFAGETIQPDKLVDNLPAHAAGHREFMRTASFLQWPNDAKARLRTHLEATDLLEQQQAMPPAGPMPPSGPSASGSPMPDPNQAPAAPPAPGTLPFAA